MAEQGCRPLERLADPAHTLAVRKFASSRSRPMSMPCRSGCRAFEVSSSVPKINVSLVRWRSRHVCLSMSLCIGYRGFLVEPDSVTRSRIRATSAINSSP